MSESANYRWRLRQEARHREYLSRISETTSRYHARYSALLADLAQQGLDQFMPAEFARARSQLSRLSAMLGTDPEAARDLSMALGAEFSSLPAMARAAQREFQEREGRRQAELVAMRRQATSELAAFLHSLIAEISDPIEQDFAFDGIKALQAAYVGRTVEPSELERSKQELRTKVNTMRSEASVQAVAWKARSAQQNMREARQTLIGMHRDAIAQDVDKHPRVMQSALTSLDAMGEEVGGAASSMADVQRQIEEVASRADAAVIDENCRRATVRAVMESLQKAGFVVATPQRHTGEVDEVVISARKPAGAEASFRVTADGAMTYKFDRYEGSKCKADIGQILPVLQDVYGVELSDARVLWQNPDRISQNAKPVDDGRKELRRGK